MNDYRHHVSGFFANREEAESALSRLVERGLPRSRLQLFETTAPRAAVSKKTDSKEVLHDVLKDGAIGVAVGTAIGALAELALVATSVSLFIASPLIAPLAMMGWGASLGGFVGAATGAATGPASKQGGFEALVVDAISSGQVVLLAETRTEAETELTKEVIQVSVNSVRDVTIA